MIDQSLKTPWISHKEDVISKIQNDMIPNTQQQTSFFSRVLMCNILTVDYWGKMLQHGIYDPILYAQEETAKKPNANVVCLWVMGSQMNLTLLHTPLNFLGIPDTLITHSKDNGKESLCWLKEQTRRHGSGLTPIGREFRQVVVVVNWPHVGQ